MTRKFCHLPLVVILIIAVTLLTGCSKDKVFITVVADPPTIAPEETSSITAIVTAGENSARSKPIADVNVRFWIAAGEKVFAKLSNTSATTDQKGNASVQLTALDISPNKAIHVTAKVKDISGNCAVMVKKRPSETPEDNAE
ncbi:MAG: Ig-like domain-containing protein [Planctomycetota bacterium]|jgi:hypothetical protein